MPSQFARGSSMSEDVASQPAAQTSAALKKVLATAVAEKLTLVPSANVSGFKHVRHVPLERNPWKARHVDGDRVRHLGYYSTAVEAVLQVARRLGPEGSCAAAAAAVAAGVAPVAPAELSASAKRRAKKRSAAEATQTDASVREGDDERSQPIVADASAGTPRPPSSTKAPATPSSSEPVSGEPTSTAKKHKSKRKKSGRPAQRRARAEAARLAAQAAGVPAPAETDGDNDSADDGDES